MLSFAIYSGHATGGISTAIIGGFGLGLVAYGSGMLEDPTNQVNQVNFMTSIAFSAAAPLACAKVLNIGGTAKYVKYPADLIGSVAKGIVKGTKETILGVIGGPGIDIAIKGIYY